MTTAVNMGIDPHRLKGSPFILGTNREQRAALTAVIVRDLAEHLEIDELGRAHYSADAMWQRLRDVALGPDADAPTVGTLLSLNPEIPSPGRVIAEIVNLILDARARRAELVAQLEALDQLEALFQQHTKKAKRT